MVCSDHSAEWVYIDSCSNVVSSFPYLNLTISLLQPAENLSSRYIGNI